MPGEVLTWEWRLVNEVSREAGKVDKSLEKSDRGMKGMIRTFHDLEHIAQMTFRGIHKAVELASVVVDARRWKEETMIGLRAVTGSAKAAQAVFSMAEGFAIQTGASTEEVVDAAKRLTIAGYSLEDTRVLSAVLQDTKVIQGAEAMGTVADALAKMGTAGHVTERTMLALNSVAGLGGRVQDILSKRLHVSADELKKLVQAGRIGKDWGAFAIAEGMRQLEGGKLGAVTKEMSETVSGLVGSIKDELMALFTENGGAGGFADGMKGLLKDVKALLEPGSPFITGVKAGLAELTAGFGGGLKTGHDFTEQMRELGVMLHDVASAAATIAGTLKYITAGVYAMGHADEVLQRNEELAKGTVPELTPGQRAEVERANHEQYVRDLAASPDTLNVPHMAAGGLVHRPTLALIGEAGPEAVVPLGSGPSGGGGGRVHPVINIAITIHGGGSGAAGSSDQDPTKLADTLTDVLLQRLTGAFEDLGIEGGQG